MGVFVQVNDKSPKAKSNPIGYVIQANGCWDWVGAKTLGYGTLSIASKTYLAHRVFYSQKFGAIPTNQEIDHLCRNPSCVNPGHLEAVTHQENVIRGNSPGAIAVRTNLCKRGHLFDEVRTKHERTGRKCRQCLREQSGRRWECVPAALPNKHKTHCPAGHLYTEETTIRDRMGWRKCRICRSLLRRAGGY